MLRLRYLLCLSSVHVHQARSVRRNVPDALGRARMIRVYIRQHAFKVPGKVGKTRNSLTRTLVDIKKPLSYYNSTAYT